MKLITRLFFIIVLLILVYDCKAQLNLSAKAFESLNSDSTTVRSLAMSSTSNFGNNTTTGWMYYNPVTKKWRVYSNGIWNDLGLGAGGGNLSGALTTPRIPYASASHTLVDVPNMIWDVSTDRQLISNDAGTATTSTFGGQITISEPGASESIVATVTAGDPVITFTDGAVGTILDKTGITSNSNIQFSTSNGASTNSSSGLNTINGGNVFVNATSVNGDITMNTGTGDSDIQLVATSDILLQANTGNATLASVGVAGDAIINGARDVLVTAVRTSQIGSTLNSSVGSSGYVSMDGADSVTMTSFTHPASFPRKTWKNGQDYVYQPYTFNGPEFDLSMTGSLNWFNAGTGTTNWVIAGDGFTTDNFNDVIFTFNGRFAMTTLTNSIAFNSGTDFTIGGANVDINASDIQLTSTGDVNITQNGIGPFNVYAGVTLVVTFNFASTISLAESTLTTSSVGQNNGDACVVTSPFTVGVYTCNVSSGTINVTFHNTTAATVDPASGSYKIMLIK